MPRKSLAEEKCRITVEDNGIGFDQQYAERIFGIFQRLHPRNVYEGTGIGLAICRRIVEYHGGQISVQSTPGKGSTFEVLLPVAQAKKKHARPSDGEPARALHDPHGRRRCRRLPPGSGGLARVEATARPADRPRRPAVAGLPAAAGRVSAVARRAAARLDLIGPENAAKRRPRRPSAN